MARSWLHEDIDKSFRGHRKDSRRRYGGHDGSRDRSRDRRRVSRGARNGNRHRSRKRGDRSRSRSWRGRRHQQTNRRSRSRRSRRYGRNRRSPARGARRRSGSSSSCSSRSSSSDSRAAASPGKKKEKAKAGSDDSDTDEIVHFEWARGMLLNSRYCAMKLLGDGTFGRVLLATDEQQNKNVAVKVIRGVERYQENAQIEADILKDIRRKDPHGEASRSSVMIDSFSHKNHFCMVFEPCGLSLYDFMKRNQYRGFWLQDIQHFARQSLTALAFLHEDMQMTHTDLKPENILIESMEEPRTAFFPRQGSWTPSSAKAMSTSQYVRPANPNVRLIDFGNATYEDERHSTVINTRQYRGPEVILGLGWNDKSDIWSMGCILMELYTGELLFGTHENLEHLAMMERTCDQFSSSMLSKASTSVREKYVVVDRHGQSRLAWPEKAPVSRLHKVRDQRRLHDLLTTTQHSSFADLVGDLLVLDAAKRSSAKRALQHKFFQKNFSD